MTIYELLEAYKQAKSIYEMPIRVAYYARVSSEKDAQLHSLDNQIDYYEHLIRSTSNWTYVRGYVDEGITGTSALHREQFLRMIADAKAGEFDLLITKEISRFARNTLDSIGYTRELFAAGVGVFFENDNINTLAADGELRLTILSSIAQDEVRKLSERVRYGFRCSQEKGVVLGNSAIWGYTKEKGTLKLCPEEAQIVRRIFEEYAYTDAGLRKISAGLAAEGILNRNGKPFSYSTLRSILTNPKYKGFYCARKTSARPLFLPKGGQKQVFAQEDWLLYKAEDTVPPIVSEAVWEAANAKLKSRGERQAGQDRVKAQNRYPYSGRIFCSRHQSLYYRSMYRYPSGNREVWMCAIYQKYGRDAEKGCDQPVIYGDELDQAVRLVLEESKPDRESIALELEQLYQALHQQGRESGEQKRLEAALARTRERKERLLELRLDGEISAGDFGRKSKELEAEEIRLKGALRQTEGAPGAAIPTLEQICQALQFPSELPGCLIEGLVRRVEVSGQGGLHLTVTLNGAESRGVQVRRKRGRRAELSLLPSVCSASGT